MFKKPQQLESELTKLHVQYDNLLTVYEASQTHVIELVKKVEALQKTCEFLSNVNCGLMGDLTVTAMSRQRALNQLPEGAQWAERTMTSYERANTTPVETNPQYTEFFHDA
jgi:hypothetical protein